MIEIVRLGDSFLLFMIKFVLLNIFLLLLLITGLEIPIANININNNVNKKNKSRDMQIKPAKA